MTSGDLDLWDTVIKRNMYTSGCVFNVFAKNEIQRTDRQKKTNKAHYVNDNIDCNYSHGFILTGDGWILICTER